MRKLARRPHRVVVAAGVVLRHGGARLHRIADQAVIDQADLGDMRRISKRRSRGLGIAALPVETGVVGNLIKNRSGAWANGVEDADHRRQHLVVDFDRFGRLAGLIERFGDHERHRIADTADLVDRHRRARRLLHRRTVGVADAPGTRQTSNLVRG